MDWKHQITHFDANPFVLFAQKRWPPFVTFAKQVCFWTSCSFY